MYRTKLQLLHVSGKCFSENGKKDKVVYFTSGNKSCKLNMNIFLFIFVLKKKKKSAVMYSKGTEVAGQPRLNKSLSQQQQIVQ